LKPPKGASWWTLWFEFTDRAPVRIDRATLMARPRSRVQSDPERPYWTSFASRIASASSPKGMMAATGPKISSCATRMRLSTSANTVGARKLAPAAEPSGAPPPVTSRAPSSRPTFTYASTFWRWEVETSGPISVSGSSGSPTRMRSARRPKALTKSS